MPEAGDMKVADILIVEDDPGDLNMMKRFMEDSNFRNNIYEVMDGQEARDFLYQQNEYSDPEDAPRPDLILLDLNLPKVDGRELLEEINNDESLRKIPVVVLTTSQEQTEIWKSYDIGAASYIIKPVDMEQFRETIQTLKRYWFQVVVFPEEEQ
ncbi:MAG: response regulator [bacterium]